MTWTWGSVVDIVFSFPLLRSRVRWWSRRPFQQHQIQFSKVLYHAIETERRRHERIPITFERIAEIAEEGLEVARRHESQEARVVLLQLERMWRARGNVEKVSSIQSCVTVAGKHLHLALKTMKELRDLFVLMPRNCGSDGALGKQSDENPVAVR